MRVDSGVAAGSTVSPYYDSMIAKLVGTGANRAAAVRALRAGLADFETLGVGTNQLFVADLLAQPQFLAQALTTSFIGDVFPAGWTPPAEIGELALVAAAFCELHGWTTEPRRTPTPWHAATGFRNVAKDAWARFVADSTPVWLARHGEIWRARVGEAMHDVAIAFDRPDHIRVGAYRFGIAGRTISYRGVRYAPSITSELADRARSVGDQTARGGAVHATLPGLVTAVNVEVGQQIAAGEIVVVMESMKLVFALEAPIAGRVTAVACRPGQTVANAVLLVQIVPI